MTDAPHVDVGSARLWLLNDGRIPDSAQGSASDGSGMIEVNAFLVESMGRVILVDSGFGAKWLDEEPDLQRPAGSVFDGLARCGFSPADVDVVVNTHLHVDHAGGDTAYDAAGQVATAFPGATYMVQAAEWAFAIEPPASWSHLFRGADFEPLWDLGRLRLVEGTHRVTDEVTCVPAPGHTPGHQVVQIVSRGESALIAGDAIHNDGFLARPGDLSGLDVDPALASRTREELAGWAREHAAWLGLAHAGSSVRRVEEVLAHLESSQPA